MEKHSTTRQKSCDACVRTKRRCDKLYPRCSRCIEKDCECVYQKIPRMGYSQLASMMEVDSTADPTRSLPTPPHPPAFQVDPLDLHLHPDIATIDPGLALADLDTNFHFSFNSFLNAEMEKGQGLWPAIHRPTLHADSGLATSPSPSTATTTGQLEVLTEDEMRILKGPDIDRCAGANFKPWHLYEPNSRVAYLVRTFKSIPQVFSRERAAPFLHRILYRSATPESIKEAFGACQVYTNRSDATASWSYRILYEKAQELLVSCVQAHTPLEKLARTQALLFFQVMRIFDGDISLRAQAEVDMAVFEGWLVDLCKVRDNLIEEAQLDDVALKENPPKSWERWIFGECLRRSIIMGYAFMTLYDLIKSNGFPSTPSYWSVLHRYTVSKHLWEADSPTAFFRAWREKPQFVIKSTFPQEYMKCIRGEDVDEFSKILLTAHIGVEEAEAYLNGG